MLGSSPPDNTPKQFGQAALTTPFVNHNEHGNHDDCGQTKRDQVMGR